MLFLYKLNHSDSILKVIQNNQNSLQLISFPRMNFSLAILSFIFEIVFTISDESGKSVLHGVASMVIGCGISARYPGNVYASVYSMINFIHEVLVSNSTFFEIGQIRRSQKSIPD